MQMNTVGEKLEKCFESVRKKISFRPQAALVLGSGLGSYADEIQVSEMLDYYKENEPRGEYVLVLEGKSFETIAEEEKKSWEAMTIEEHMAVYEGQGIDRKEAMKLVAKDRGISKRDVYQALL